ncbi:Retrovirus-related Pol poly from transposon [Paramuricea clavata]|uniref:Retrovirus-related Pol poly from transposon n=1 Tax=Paramuricea clavata TaxID=317549 RepID=A0A7D9HTD9_PARCT|nr:Retrovirus-related Pol poly from transposon [Paramuricea clavata]CAB4023026.1 Retrovirus-related Pol poly from transposon [Paramuricea clavata]
MNLTLNPTKCEYNKPSVEFYGYIFSKGGVSLDPKKVEAFQQISAPQNPTESDSTLIVDASPVGLGAIFMQKNSKTKEEKVNAFASRALNPVEQRYSQTEKEALAILWAWEHFHLYVYGSHFTVITDHKPLEQIHANPRSRCSARLERWSLKLQRYDFTVKYQPGKSNPAD